MFHVKRLLICAVIGMAVLFTITQSLDCPTKKIPSNAIIAAMEVRKSRRCLILYDDKQNIIQNYKIALGHAPQGKKNFAGDGKTPEGIYKIILKNNLSHYYKSLKISYPDEQDKQSAAATHRSAGGDIFIHGIGNQLGWLGSLHRLVNWTDGCIAVTNRQMDEIYNLVTIGTPITIKPYIIIFYLKFFMASSYLT